MPLSLYLSKADARVEYAFKRKLLDRLIRTGKVRASKVGPKTILIERKSIEEWIASNEITPVDRQVTKSALQDLMDRAIRHANRQVHS